MRITPSQVGKMVVAYTLTSVNALASHLSASPSPSPSVLPCDDIHGNCDAWHHCTVDNQNCIWGIGVALFTVAAVLVYAVGYSAVRRCKDIRQRDYTPVLGAAPEEQTRMRGLIEERSASIVDLANQPDLGKPLNATIQTDYHATTQATTQEVTADVEPVDIPLAKTKVPAALTPANVPIQTPRASIVIENRAAEATTPANTPRTPTTNAFRPISPRAPRISETDILSLSAKNLDVGRPKSLNLTNVHLDDDLVEITKL